MNHFPSRASDTTPASRPHAEPEENDAQIARLLDSMLDEIEASMRKAINYGLATPLRDIVARMLPAAAAVAEPQAAPVPSTTVSPEAPAAPAAPTPQPHSPIPAGVDIDVMLGLYNAAQALDEHARRAKPDSPAGKRDAHCSAFLKGEIEKLKRNTRS